MVFCESDIRASANIRNGKFQFIRSSAVETKKFYFKLNWIRPKLSLKGLFML